MRILGIDPGYAIVGFGVIDKVGNGYKVVDFGVITTPQEMDMPERLKTIYTELCEIINRYHPEVCGIEDLYFTNNAKTAIKVGQARGVCVLACAMKDIDTYSYTPLQVKQALVGYGRAEKAQVQAMVTSMLRLKEIPKPDDAADALAIAITHGNSAEYLDKLKHAK
ncbi:MAG: crossover junction endodeoxyribonuclease RuvC [Clostridiales Family XIII bacterium]|jgi:crossover junction endodeoxyribonuclease RuvC|nr:crossover junction endodeoxyribonuclease RuvC [Clostridiales Family XIII bacterium]